MILIDIDVCLLVDKEDDENNDNNDDHSYWQTDIQTIIWKLDTIICKLVKSESSVKPWCTSYAASICCHCVVPYSS